MIVTVDDVPELIISGFSLTEKSSLEAVPPKSNVTSTLPLLGSFDN